MPRRRDEARSDHARPDDVSWGTALAAYLTEVETFTTEDARSVRFAMLLQELLGVQPGLIDNYAAGIERHIRVAHKDRILRGAIDNLFGNVVIEFESQIPAHLPEAEEQLRRYVAILWSHETPERRTPFLCLATDGVRFVTFLPKAAPAEEVTPDLVQLHVLERVDWSQLEPTDVFFWLDRHLVRREIIPPTSVNIVADFGARSHAFQAAATELGTLWATVQQLPHFAVVFAGWDKYLRVVYGSNVAVEELFVRHTYLATLAKLMAWRRISSEPDLPDRDRIRDLLEGRLFKELGIENFIEEDFFSWPAREEAFRAGEQVVRWLFGLLRSYRLDELSEDVLKSLYQELVDPETRHDLGEFYTPEWLAERMLAGPLERKPRASVLDPSCGSGTFLYQTIRKKRVLLGDSLRTLGHILSSVCGIDIHPLAVIVAKTNYLLALGELLRRRQGAISLPVFLADTIRLPRRDVRTTLWMQLPSYSVQLDGREIFVPEQLLAQSGEYDTAIELCKEFALANKGRRTTSDKFREFLGVQGFGRNRDEAFVEALYGIASVLQAFIEEDRDSIWAFVLKNIYKPLFLRRKFELVVGNPPWLALRYTEPAYQSFLKKQIIGEYHLLKKSPEHLPNLELGTLFLVQAADLYLAEGGEITFVLPRSIFTADQHAGLRQQSFSLAERPGHGLRWTSLVDLEGVTPLFNVPACTLAASFVKLSDASPQQYPIEGEVLTGTLPRKNLGLAEAMRHLSVERVAWTLHTRGNRSYWSSEVEVHERAASYYKRAFIRGVNALIPHSFWLVETEPSRVGFDFNLPLVKTSSRSEREAKGAYRGLSIRGRVEPTFLFATLLATDLLPFSHYAPRLALVPLVEDEGTRTIVDAKWTRDHGYVHLARWLVQAEREWNERRGARAKKLSLYAHLDLFGGITKQNPHARCWVAYNKSGTYLTASVVLRDDLTVDVGGTSLAARGFVADQTLYTYSAETEAEAYYLAAILNSPALDAAIKPLQSRGLFGPRDIHKKPLEFPIPRFEPGTREHQSLARLGEACRGRVFAWLRQAGNERRSIGVVRGSVRELLSEELREIDRLSKHVLGLSSD